MGYNKTQRNIIRKLDYSIRFLIEQGDKYLCECGSVLCVNGKYVHDRTNKHKKHMMIELKKRDELIMAMNKKRMFVVKYTTNLCEDTMSIIYSYL